MASCFSPAIAHRARVCSGAAASSSSSSSPSVIRPLARHRPLSRRTNAVTVRFEDGRTVEVTDAEWTVGSDAKSASCQAGSAPIVAAVHARLNQKRRGTSAATQVFLTGLVDLDEGAFGNSRTWLDGQPLRPGVQYVIGSGQRVEIGATGGVGGASAFTVEFSEGTGRDPLVEMMMAGMAGSQGAKLKDALK